MECKHPEAFRMNRGNGWICALCGARVEEKKEPVKRSRKTVKTAEKQ